MRDTIIYYSHSTMQYAGAGAVYGMNMLRMRYDGMVHQQCVLLVYLIPADLLI
jgi:hypothetical protein